MGQMIDYIRNEPELRERFIRRAFEQRRITDFPSFQQALFEAFDTERGSRAKKFFGDEEIMVLFKSEEARSHLSQNVTEEELNKIYGDADKGTYAVMRKEPTGQAVKTKDVFTVETPKKIRIEKKYTRTVRGQKISVKPYYRGFSKWSNSQLRFIKVRKEAGVLSVKDIIYQYNRHYTTETRSSSSISTKFYRI